MLLLIDEIINAVPKHTLIVVGSPRFTGLFLGIGLFLLTLHPESRVITLGP